MIYALTIVFTFLFIFYQKEQYNDLLSLKKYGSVKNRWKVWGWFMKFLFIVAIFLSQFFTTSYQDCLLSGSISWVIFELFYNKIVLKEKWFYVGQSSIQDNKLGFSKWYVMAGVLIASVLIKIYVR